jgi:hypothetical protein
MLASRPPLTRALTRNPIAAAWLLWGLAYLARSLTLKRPTPQSMAGLVLLLWIPALAACALYFLRAARAAPGLRKPPLALAIPYAVDLRRDPVVAQCVLPLAGPRRALPG